MLQAVLCARPHNRLSLCLSPHTFFLQHTHHHPHQHHCVSHPDHHPSLSPVNGGASIWRAAGGCDWRRDFLRPPSLHHLNGGEGSWNVAYDARPARWLHRLDLAYLLSGLCLALDIAPPPFTLPPPPPPSDVAAATSDPSPPYTVKAVPADGRCLFRAIAHGACLQSGEEAPDENRQRELADELRAQVVDELLKRREEVKEFFDEDFDDYVERIRQPYVWGGECELRMASHVLKKLITVFMKDRTTGDLRKLNEYGEEYKNDKELPINVLFHGYGHYEILEISDDCNFTK